MVFARFSLSVFVRAVCKRTGHAKRLQRDPCGISRNQIFGKWGIRFAPPMLNWADGVDSTGGFSFNLPRFCANVP